jgi:uncharacterized membrane protein YkvA (DUF1232 family)
MMQSSHHKRQIRLKDLARAAPQLAKLVFRLSRDPRVPARNKTTLVLVGVYLVSPIDLIPAFVPGLGQFDDLVMAALALDQLLNDVDAEVVREHWDGEQDVLEVIQETLRLATSFVPARVRRMFSSR